MQDPVPPSFPATEPNQPEIPPSPPSFDNPPLTPIAANISEPAPDPNATAPSVPDLTVPEPPQFPDGNNTPPPSPMDPPVMVRGEANIPPSVQASSGVTTATILPVGSGGTDMISYPSSGGPRRFLIPLTIGLIILLLIGGGTFLFFQLSAPQDIEAPATTTDEAQNTPEPTVPPEESLPTVPYENTEFGFTVDYPQDWTMKENTNGNVVVFTDPTTTTVLSKVSILTEETISDVTTYAESLQKIFSQLYNGWVNINTTATSVGALAAVEVESTYTKGADNISVLQLIVVSGGKAFTITAEAEESAFQTLRSTYTNSLASLQFTNQ